MRILLLKVVVPALALSVAASALALPAATNRLSSASKSGAAAGATKLEQEVLAELNLARQKPLEYAKYVEEHRARFNADGTFTLRSRVRMVTKEGVKAVDEAIAFLKQVKAVGPLEYSAGLSRAARDHVEDLGPKGMVGHGGSDGSDPASRVKRYGEWETTTGENIAFGHDDARMTVIQLIVDDGVPSRGHRANIFHPKFKTVGIACGDHKVYRQMCVMDFAGGFKDKKSDSPVRGRTLSPRDTTAAK
jgi:uncharacterized protein YkwD